MARPKSELPKYRHFKPKDLAVVRIDGKDHYLGKFNSPESWERYHRLLADRRANTPLPSPEPIRAKVAEVPRSVADVMLAYWDHAQTYYRRPDGSPGPEIRGLKIALRPLRKTHGSTAVANFGPMALKEVRQTMIATGLARSTINLRVGKILRMFRWAVENELVPPSIHHALKTVPGLKKGRTVAPEPAPVRPVADADVEAIRPFVSRHVWAMIELQRLTGARPGEIVALRTGDLDRSGDLWIYRPRAHKGTYLDKDRPIILGPRAREVITPFLKADPDACLFRSADIVAELMATRKANRKSRQVSKPPKVDPVWVPGDSYSVAIYHKAIARGCDRAHPHPTIDAIPAKDRTPEQVAELKAWRKAHRWHPHQLRHAAATTIRAKYGLEAAQVILGHSRADVTQVYAERDLAKAREVMKEIG